MHLRKLLIAGSAMAAAAAFVLVPVAQASTPGGNPGSVRVGANTTGTYPITGTLKSGASFTLNIYGSPTKAFCYAGTNFAGTATAGSPVPNPVLRFTALNLTCNGLTPGQAWFMSIPNTGCVTWNPSGSALVHDGLTDYGPKGAKFQEVLGALTIPTNCVMTVTAGSCTITIAGVTTSNFYEAKSATDATQGLNLKGAGLTVRTASPLCLGAATVGSALTMNSVDFNIASPSGAIDIRDN
jgi:hypothetical protein